MGRSLSYSFWQVGPADAFFSWGAAPDSDYLGMIYMKYVMPDIVIVKSRRNKYITAKTPILEKI